ncbi:MAG: hypothetical protein ACI4AN_08040 [Muribaculaceae bacterium]
MKKSILLFACCGFMTFMACTGSKNANENEESSQTELSDSLQTVNAEKDSLMSLMAEISEGMMQIKDMEKILTSPNINRESTDKKEEIRNDMIAIQQALEERRNKLNALEARLKKSAAYNESMKKTVESLKSQIEAQETTIAGLQDALHNANITIEGLNTRVDSLARVSAAERTQKTIAQEEATRLANELNICYYVVGSKKELKENKIVESGFLRKTKIMESDYEMSYFTKADKRSLSVLPLHSKKAKLLSKHPSGSYEIVDTDGTKTLRITNATRFWEMSNFLIVQVD